MPTDKTTARSLQELQSTGHCIDAIRYKKLTLPFAGRSAFATCDYANGAIITGSPLIHVPYESLAYLYGNYYDNEVR